MLLRVDSMGLSSKLMAGFSFPVSVWVAALVVLVPFFIAAFCPSRLEQLQRLPLAVRLGLPCVFCIPYALVALAHAEFRWSWFALYLFLPLGITWLLYRAAVVDAEQRGDWRDFLILAVLGLAVDLRWFEPGWPLSSELCSTRCCWWMWGFYGFLVIRRLDGVGFDLRLRPDGFAGWAAELGIYAPIAIVLGLALGFLHFHAQIPTALQAALAWVFTFFFIAVPEELFFRGWMQNLLERRVGRHWALVVTAVLFGLSHFNKRALHFNWRYVVLAAIAGIFYGRAWRQERRVGSFGDYPCFGGYALVALAAIVRWAGSIE